MANETMKKSILEAVDSQLIENTPPCVKTTYDKLISQGVSEAQAKEMIGVILIEELYDVLKYNEQFNEQRYCRKLSNLTPR